MGKQQIAEITFFDYIVGITIGSIASTISVQLNENTFATLVGMIVWGILLIFVSNLSINNVWLRKVFEGEATTVIQNGKILEKNLKRLRLSVDDLISQLRSQGVFNIKEIEFALFEKNGNLSIQKKSQFQPVTPEDINISTSYDGLPTNLIDDGILLIDAIKSLKLSKAWLFHQLKKEKIYDIKKVSLAQLDTKGNLYIDLKDNNEAYIIDTT
jgi:uncharacterized membrane protein YcaP (DUF421 family)